MEAKGAPRFGGRARTVTALVLLAVVIAAVCLWALPSAGSSPAVDLAAGFGDAGVVDVPASEDIDNWAFGFQAASLPGGGIVVAGNKEVLALGSGGVPVPGFGRDGIKRIGEDDGLRMEIEDVAVDDRGRILLFGGATKPADERESKGGRFPSQAVVMRLLPDGAFDRSFGRGGIVHDAFGVPVPSGEKPFVSADLGGVDGRGRPIFTLPTTYTGHFCDGVSPPYTATDQVRLERLRSDGSVDTGFDGDAIPAAFAGGSTGTALQVRGDGGTEIVAQSTAGCGERHELLILRRRGNGSPDDGFGPEGVRSVRLVKPKATAPAGGGGTLILGPSPYRPDLDTKSAPIELLNADGSLDRRFGSDGTATATIPDSHATFNAVLADPRGRIYVVGTEGIEHVGRGDRDHSRIAVMRLSPDGDLDRSFGVEGLATAEVPGRFVHARTAVLSGSKLIVVATGVPIDFHSNPEDLVLVAFKTS